MSEEQPNIITILFPTLSPIQRAELELMKLADDPELQPIVVLGGSWTQDDILENQRRRNLYTERIVAVIKKYGVEEVYLQIHYDIIADLEDQLTERKAFVAALKEK